MLVFSAAHLFGCVLDAYLSHAGSVCSIAADMLYFYKAVKSLGDLSNTRKDVLAKAQHVGKMGYALLDMAKLSCSFGTLLVEESLLYSFVRGSCTPGLRGSRDLHHDGCLTWHVVPSLVPSC
jgi:hypothetical protein